MAIWLRFKGYIIAIAGAILGALSIYFVGRSQGAKDAEIEQERADYERARKIEDLADRVRRADGDNATAIERLSKRKRLRDL